jgi:hypothetical protein
VFVNHHTKAKRLWFRAAQTPVQLFPTVYQNRPSKARPPEKLQNKRACTQRSIQNRMSIIDAYFELTNLSISILVQPIVCIKETQHPKPNVHHSCLFSIDKFVNLEPSTTN